MSKEHPAGHVLQAYHDGELGAAEAETVAAHCAACAACRAELAELKRMGELLAATPAPAAARSVWPRLQAARRDADRADLRLGPAFAALAAAACVAGLVIGIWFGPIQVSAEKADSELAWSASSTIWNGDTDASLLDVFTSGQE